ncbi:MAG: hypothetical protein L7F78_16590, partial [Syntrophales bacterium LBB04]|nr:hypothetical protein [Syntrophales bacterium LBB04]
MDHSQGKFKSDDAGRLGVVPPSPGIKEASHIIAAMNLIRMNLGMYPPGHVRISESVDSAHDLIKKVLRGKTEWVIRVAGNTLIFGETVLDKKNSAFRDYATCLSNLRIIAIILHRNVKKDELVSFNRLLSYKPMDIWARGKLEDVMAREGITGIAVKVIDMDAFHLTEESEIVKDKSDANTSNEDFWQDFISRLTSGTEKSGTDGDIPSGHEKLDPAEAVRFLNERRENWQAAVECY